MRVKQAHKGLLTITKPVVNVGYKISPVAGKCRENNLHKSFKVMFILGQIFGYLPVQGITGPDHRSLFFRWASLRVIYSLTTIMGACFVSGLQLHKIVVKGMDLAELDRFFFFLSGVLTGSLFLKFSMQWPRLMKDWNAVEMTMASYGWPSGLNLKMNVLTGAFMAFALVEHILVQSNKLVLALSCQDGTYEAFTYFLSNMSFSHAFSITEYSIFKGLALQAINLQLTFAWTFIDLFVMLISTALAFRFHQVSARIQSLSDANIISEEIWKQVREDYTRLSKLCRRINGEIAYIVLLSFACDIFFILNQLFNTIRPMRNDLERIYFYCSFGLLIVRTICLCLYGAKVNDESKNPVDILNEVSSDVYNLEIAGTIVTYELVLIQFNDRLHHVPLKIGTCPVFV